MFFLFHYNLQLFIENIHCKKEQSIFWKEMFRNLASTLQLQCRRFQQWFTGLPIARIKWVNVAGWEKKTFLNLSISVQLSIKRLWGFYYRKCTYFDRNKVFGVLMLYLLSVQSIVLYTIISYRLLRSLTDSLSCIYILNGNWLNVLLC